VPIQLWKYAVDINTYVLFSSIFPSFAFVLIFHRSAVYFFFFTLVCAVVFDGLLQRFVVAVSMMSNRDFL